MDGRLLAEGGNLRVASVATDAPLQAPRKRIDRELVAADRDAYDSGYYLVMQP